MDSPILFWNAVALECNRLDHTGVMAARNQRGPTLSSRALAMVHIALHDAHALSENGLTGSTLDAYLPNARRPTFSQLATSTPPQYAAVAVAAAGSVVLLNLYANLSGLINQEFAKFCSMHGSDESAHRFGSAVARAVIDLRKDDGAFPEPPADHMDSAARGRHREDPLNSGQGLHGARYGFVRPFAVSTFHALTKYPLLDSAKYLADLAEVKTKGVTTTSNMNTRTADETVQGTFWAYDGVKDIGTPPRLYNQVLREVIKPLNLSLTEQARLFLLANLAMGDAGILAWWYKFHFDLWRPIVGIREHSNAMGPAALVGSAPIDPPCDPFWRPLGAPKTNSVGARIRSFTPPFPAYPSGHATFGAAAFHVARLYLQSIGKAVIAADKSDNLAFQLVSDEMNGVSIDPDDTIRPRHMRGFPGLHQAIYENSVSRVFLGVHWRFDGLTGANAASMFTNASDGIGGVSLGLKIADDLASMANLRPSPVSVKPPVFDATP